MLATQHSCSELQLTPPRQAGPVFGAGYDILICSNSNTLANSTSALGMTYKADDNLGNLSAYLAGDSAFALSEMEVFKVVMN